MNSDPYRTPPRNTAFNGMSQEPSLAISQLHALKAHDVARKVKSFDHFLHIWGAKAGYYVPPKTVLTWHYISQALAGEKKLLRVQDVGHIQDLPRAKGILVSELWDACKDLQEFHAYFPDATPSSRITRTYFLNVTIIRFCESCFRTLIGNSLAS